MRYLPALLLLAALSPPALAEERFALLVGANAGWADDRPLRYAEADAERLRDVLVELGGFAAERVELLRDPDTATLRDRLAQLAQRVQALGETESLVVFYYSGHADARHLHLRGPPLSYAELYEALRDMPATVRLGILDACRSGSLLAAKGGRPVASAFEVRVVDELRVRGLALLTSSGADELAQEARTLAGSVFTHHLVSGLRGAADHDGDGAVVLSEAWRHAHQRTEVDTAATAAPHRPAFLYELAGQGDPVLTRPAQGLGRLLLPAGEGERYVVVDERGTRLVAEGRTRPQGRVALALAPGTYQLTHVRAQALGVASLRVAPGAQVEAERLAYTPRPLAAGVLKGQPEEMDAEERYAWRRGEALRLLDEGEPEAALKAFEELLTERPADPGAQRGRARALVRLSEARRRGGQLEQEHALLRQALAAEPSLVEDPDFHQRYQRSLAHEAASQRSRERREQVDGELYMDLYLGRRWGVAMELESPRGVRALSGLLLFEQRWMASATLDVTGVGLGVGVRHLTRCTGMLLVGLPVRLCPNLGLGLHVALADVLGTPRATRPTGGRSESVAQALATSRLHAGGGLLFLLDGGGFFSAELGLVLYAHRPSGAPAFDYLPGYALGWLF